jgi:hypothetical protein
MTTRTAPTLEELSSRLDEIVALQAEIAVQSRGIAGRQANQNQQRQGAEGAEPNREMLAEAADSGHGAAASSR